MPELMIHLENDSRKPLYEQIYDYIRMSIADGKISRGEKLPSTRFLAGHYRSQGVQWNLPMNSFFRKDI